GAGVQRTAPDHGAEDDVGVAPGIELVEEPEALLGEGEGEGARGALLLPRQAGQQRQLLLASEGGPIRHELAHRCSSAAAWTRAPSRAAASSRNGVKSVAMTRV